MKKHGTWVAEICMGRKRQANHNAAHFFALSCFDWWLLKGQPMGEGLKKCAKLWEENNAALGDGVAGH